MTTNAFTQKPDVSQFIKSVTHRYKSSRASDFDTKYRTWGKITPIPFGEFKAQGAKQK